MRLEQHLAIYVAVVLAVPATAFAVRGGMLFHLGASGIAVNSPVCLGRVRILSDDQCYCDGYSNVCING